MQCVCVWYLIKTHVIWCITLVIHSGEINPLVKEALILNKENARKRHLYMSALESHAHIHIGGQELFREEDLS